MLTDRRPILLANARLIDPSRDFDGVGDVLIADGTIRESRRGIGAAGVPEGTDIVNCAGKIVAPGLIDMRAFVGEPGASHRETFASASQAAATGGITTIICQPDTSPVIDNSATVDFVLRRAQPAPGPEPRRLANACRPASDRALPNGRPAVVCGALRARWAHHI